MNVITKEQFERLAGLRQLSPATVRINNSIVINGVNVRTFTPAETLAKEEVYEDLDSDSWECDDCEACPDHDDCWGFGEDEIEEFWEDEGSDDEECTCDICSGYDDTDNEVVDFELETLEDIFENGDWESTKEFIYEVIDADYEITSSRIAGFVQEYFDETVSVGTIAALRASWSRAQY